MPDLRPRLSSQATKMVGGKFVSPQGYERLPQPMESNDVAIEVTSETEQLVGCKKDNGKKKGKGGAIRRCCNLLCIGIVAGYMIFIFSVQTIWNDWFASPTSPKGIHLSFGEDAHAQVTIAWRTSAPVKLPTIVLYCDDLSHTVEDSAVGTSVQLHDYDNAAVFSVPMLPFFTLLAPTRFFHKVSLTSLKPGKTYSYAVMDGENPTNWARFRVPAKNEKRKFVVYGDFGFHNAQSIPHLNREVYETSQGGAKPVDAILHVGDIGYDLHDRAGKIADWFLQLIQPLASRIPYMVCPGNHEVHNNFSEYKTRFPMPGNSDGQYYSWKIGLVKIISFSTELYFYKEDSPRVLAQLNWLRKELQYANAPENRTKQPWVITMAHRPMYCSSGDPCRLPSSKVREMFESLLFVNKVDLAFFGHEHDYERMYPTYNMEVDRASVVSENHYHNANYPTQIITGAAGCPEKLQGTVKVRSMSAVRVSKYGYGHLIVMNSTHMKWEQYSTEPISYPALLQFQAANEWLNYFNSAEQQFDNERIIASSSNQKKLEDELWITKSPQKDIVSLKRQ